jgi:predicted anti-sigma-YlaC factor YlaD
MNCEQAKTRWQQCQESGAADTALDEHLAGCAECRAYARERGCLLELLGELRADTLTLQYEGDAVRTGRRGWRPRAFMTRRVPGVAAAILLVVSAAFFASRMNEQPGPQVDPIGSHPPVVALNDDKQEQMPLGITLRNESAARMLAVARPTSQSKVKVYWLYASLDGGHPSDGGANDLEQPM